MMLLHHLRCSVEITTSRSQIKVILTIVEEGCFWQLTILQIWQMSHYYWVVLHLRLLSRRRRTYHGV